jgi:hypothetical protein
MTPNEQRRQEWSERIVNYRTSGLTMPAWCTANGHTLDQLKYWLRGAQSRTS